MVTAMIRRSAKLPANKEAQGGFSLIEVVISMAVLTIGMVSLLGVFGLAMATTQGAQQDMIAKQIANEAYESIVTARNSQEYTWDDIQNSGSTNCISGASSCGIFLGTTMQIYNAGADGIYGTSDDSAAGEQTLQDPGTDGIFQTADDTFIPLTGYTRTITITNVDATLRSVNIAVQYKVTQAGLPRSYVLNSYISQNQ